MYLPPGPPFLCRLILQRLPTSILCYGIVRLLIVYLKVATPTWFAILITLSTQLIFLVAAGRWKRNFEQRDAAANGAILVPQVQGGGLSNISLMMKNRASGYPGDTLEKWREQYGETYNVDLISDCLWITFEPEHVKAMLTAQFDTFEKGPLLYTQLQDFLGTGMFNSDGDMWKFHRGMTRPFFSKERITDFDIFDRHAKNAIGQIIDRLKAGYAVDFQDVASRFTIDSATEFLFGSDIDTLSAGLPYPASSPLASSDAFMNHPSNKFASAILECLCQTLNRANYGSSWPLAEFWKNKVKPHRKVVDQFIEPVLVEALAKRTKAADSGRTASDKLRTDADEETLLNHLINQTQDIQVLKDELLNLLLAGRDTTASTLTFSIYMLTQHPHIALRLREEVLGNVGQSRPTFEQLKDMKYLRAFINETLRLYPPILTLQHFRTSNKATVFPSNTPGQKPFYVPANRTQASCFLKCVYSVLVMHRRTDLWGPDAHEFDPDRFIDERLYKYLVPNPFIFLPFNAGPRICLGQQFAYNEVSFFLVRLLQKFSGFTLASDAQPADSLPPAEWSKGKGPKATDKVRPAMHLTLFVKGGLWVRMEEAR
ncbi:cytochrome P450 monooxygenase pc-3 [Tricholoma matsutake]|nr:cytochrome P450 monooxygenase pc-3 [Tricholoma matsutake 945]